MPLSKFEANPTLLHGVKCASFSLFTLASSCANVYFRAYAIIDFLADWLVFLNTVTYSVTKIIRKIHVTTFTENYGKISVRGMSAWDERTPHPSSATLHSFRIQWLTRHKPPKLFLRRLLETLAVKQ